METFHKTRNYGKEPVKHRTPCREVGNDSIRTTIPRAVELSCDSTQQPHRIAFAELGVFMRFHVWEVPEPCMVVTRMGEQLSPTQ